MPRSPFQQPIILHVEEDEATRTAFSLLLSQGGFVVREAATGEDALRLAAEKPDLVLLGVQLADGMSGLEVCRRLKADPATSGIPILIISSAVVETEQRVRGLEGGADGYLTKPIDPDLTLAYIYALLRARRAECERDRLLERQRLHVERFHLAQLTLDSDFRIVDWNPAAEGIFGFSRKDVVGRDAVALLVPQEARGHVDEIVSRIRRGEMAAHSVNANRTRDGRTIVCQWFNTPFVDERGNFAGVVALADDITERRRLEAQCLQTRKMEAVGQLVGGVAHDFNNLLTVMNGYSELVFAHLPSDSPDRALLEEVPKAGHRAAALTRQLLAFSRQQVLAPEVLDLSAVVADLGRMLERVIGEDIDLITTLQAGLGRVKMDPGQVEQVVLNLAVNARDAMPTGGKLTIDTRNVELEDRPGRYVLLAVSDNGHGMTAEVKAHIFEPFFTTKEKGKGTGLGLAMVNNTVQQSGGHIEVDSESGVGTSFKIYLPRVQDIVKPSESRQIQNPAPRGSETVLLVEDETALRELTRLILTASGYQVLEAADGREALRVALRHRGPIHLLVSDVVMPKLSGQQLAEQLLALRPETRVLFLSGYRDDALARHGVLHERANFLAKPFTSAALARKVRDVLDGGR